MLKKGKSKHTLTLFSNKTTMDEFAKKKHPPKIVEVAKNNELSLDDILDNIKDPVVIKIEIYIFGSDSLTGVRKLYSQTYTRENIVEGEFIDENSLVIKRKREIAAKID